MRRRVEGGDEFVLLALLGSMDAVRAFVGEDPGVANISPEARELFSDFEEKGAHYEAVVKPERKPGRLRCRSGLEEPLYRSRLWPPA